jgi:hypothetical protein
MKALLIIVALAAPAAADTFEAHAQNAQAIKRLDDLVWPFVTACDKGDDTEQRQCKQLRERAIKQLGAGVLVEADAAAFDIGKWNPQKKSVPLTVVGCVRCAGVAIDGKTWFVANPSARVEGGKVRGGTLYDNAKQFPDEAAAKAWTALLDNARVQFVLKLAPKKTQVDGKPALLFDVAAWRVVNPCDGSIVVANPTSQAVSPSPCPKKN